MDVQSFCASLYDSTLAGFATSLGFESVGGTTIIADGGDASPPQWGLSVSAESATVRNTSGEKVRTVRSLVIGNEFASWALPFSASALTCQTWVTQLW